MIGFAIALHKSSRPNSNLNAVKDHRLSEKHGKPASSEVAGRVV